jgi:hypothetical protein
MHTPLQVHQCFIARWKYMVWGKKWSIWYLQGLSPCSAIQTNNRKDMWYHNHSFFEPEFSTMKEKFCACFLQCTITEQSKYQVHTTSQLRRTSTSSRPWEHQISHCLYFYKVYENTYARLIWALSMKHEAEVYLLKICDTINKAILLLQYSSFQEEPRWRTSI